MGAFHINRNGQSLGQFSDQDVADGLQSGKFLPDDLGWQEPMPAWQPLSSFTSLPPPSSDPQVLRPVLPQQGGSGDPFREVPPMGSREQLAWEAVPPLPLPAATLTTVRQVLAQPTQTFQSMATTGGVSKPMFFYVLISWLTGAVALGYQAVTMMINPQILATEPFKQIPQDFWVYIFIAALILMPVILLVRSFLTSGILHLALMMVGGAKKPYETTYRVFCYASGAASVVQLIPLVGGWLYLITSLIYSVMGLKEAHRTDLWRPVAALFLILLLCCGSIFAMITLAGVAGYTSMQSMQK